LIKNKLIDFSPDLIVVFDSVTFIDLHQEGS